MRYAVIENGIVENIIIADEQFASEQGLVECLDDTSIGDLYDGSIFSKPPVIYTPEMIEQLRDIKRESLKSERETAIAQPINNIQVGRQVDRENIEGTIERWDTLLGNPVSIDWTMADNTVQAVTKNDLQTISDQYVLRRLKMHQSYQAALTALSGIDLSSKTAVDQIEAVKING